MSTGFNLWIRHSSGQRQEIEVGNDDASNTSITVLNVKECIAREDAATPASRQRLIYKGRILEDDRSLADYDIVKGATLFMVKSAAAPTTTTPSTPPQAQTSPTPSAATPPPMGMPSRTAASPSDMSQNPVANPFGGMPPAFGGMPTPEQMQQMLNNPSIQNLLDNPDRLGQLLQSSMQHPQMQQLMESNPELRQLWNDPSMMQQAMQMMRNPNMMQQAMRQQDLAMSQLENMPGGFAALSNMYRNVQEPMMEAAAESHAGPSTTSSTGNAAASTEGATGTAMPNPWSTAPPRTMSANPSGGTNQPSSQPPNPFAAGGGVPNPWGAGAANPWAMPTPQQQPNLDQMMQMLDNPMVTQMMNNMVQNNPDMLRQMIEAQNPMMAQMFQGNPEMANNFIQNAMNPDNLRQMIQMQQNMQNSMGGTTNNSGAGMMPPPNPMMFGANPFMMPPPQTSAGGSLDFSNLLQQFQGLNTASPTGAPSQPTNPADRYRVQLRSLYDMGFDDEQASLAALQAVNGNLNRAVDHLLSSPPPAPAPAVETTPSSNQGEETTASSASEEEPPTSPKNATEKKND